MPEAKSEAPVKMLVPTAAESGTMAFRRVRLAKALAARPKAKISGLTRPPKQTGANGAKGNKFKPGSHRFKLADDDYAQLTALKQRLETLGSSVKRNELLRAGLLLLVAMNDEQLKMTLALAGFAKPVSLPQQAA